MEKCNIKLRFDGPILTEHHIDVTLLAPVLLAFGDLFREANKVINQDKVQINVLVNADIKANCITISFDLLQTMWDATKTLIHDDNVATVKEIVDWLIYGYGCVSLFQLLKWKGGQVPEVVSALDKSSHKDVVLKISGNDNTIIVSPEVYVLYQEPKVVKAVQGIIMPLIKSDGIESVSFIRKTKKETINKEEAQKIFLTEAEEVEPEGKTEIVVGHITIHSPVFDTRSKIWVFEYKGHVENIDIGSTSIANDTLQRGKSVVGDTYKVKLEIKERQSKTGPKYLYRVIEVLDFIPGKEQLDIKFPDK